MTSAIPRLLVVDDDPSLRDLLALELERRGVQVATADSAAHGLEALVRDAFDAVLTDVRMDGMDGIALCERVAAEHPDVPVVVMTSYADLETAVAALRACAFDFVVKPMDIDALSSVVRRALRRRAARTALKLLPPPTREQCGEQEAVGASRAMRELFSLVERVADSASTVLITGESGTGKELVARALHRGSRRASGPMVSINCAAMPETLLEAELFGHVKGAFTDARTDRRGLFEQGHGGTLFLDEVGEMPIRLQALLLRTLQERTVRPIGATKEIRVDVRVIAATNRDLAASVREGRFRQDLYYRLEVVELRVPPLRDRGDDVLLCARHFIAKFAQSMGRPVVGMTEDCAEKLLAHDWPGNVRELENAMERAVLLAAHELVTVADLPDAVRRASAKRAVREDQLLPLDEIERLHVERVIASTHGNMTRAARILQVDRRTLYRMRDRDRDRDRREPD